MKIRTSALFATAIAIMAFSMLAHASSISYNVYANAIDSNLYTQLYDGDLALVFLGVPAKTDLYVENGMIYNAQEYNGNSEIDYDWSDEEIISGIYEDELAPDSFGDGTVASWWYLVAVKDQNGAYRALSCDGNDLIWLQVFDEGGGTTAMGSAYNQVEFEIIDEENICNLFDGSWNVPAPDDPPVPVISSFSVSAGVATLVVTGAESGVFYTIWSGSTPATQDSFVECKQATGEEVTFSIATTDDAAFFKVGASRDKKTAP